MTAGFKGVAESSDPPVFSQMQSGRPVQIIIRGRGRVGKTVFTNTLGQFFRAAGARLEIWSIDSDVGTNALGHFFPDAKFPTKRQPIDCQRWLEAMFHDQKSGGYDVLLDMGNDAVIRKLRRDFDFPKTLEADGIRTISVFLVGPDPGDLDPVRRHLEDETSIGEAVVIVLNQGIVGHGTLRRAFDRVRNDLVMGWAEARGAVIVEMPELGCIQSVLDRKLTFPAVVNDRRQVRVDDPLSFFDQERVAIWWERDLPSCLRAIPAGWLPRLPAGGYAS